MPSLDSSSPTRTSPEYLNLAEVQKNNLKTKHMKMIKILKEKMNKFLNAILAKKPNKNIRGNEYIT